jgi:hypothetical protein
MKEEEERLFSICDMPSNKPPPKKERETVDRRATGPHTHHRHRCVSFFHTMASRKAFFIIPHLSRGGPAIESDQNSMLGLS